MRWRQAITAATGRARRGRFTPGETFASLLSVSVAAKSPQGVSRKRIVETLTSRENRWLRRFRALLRDGESSADRFIGVEGLRLVEEALRSGLAVDALLVSASGERLLPRLAQWLDPRVPVLRTSDRLFAGVADTQTPQGVAALVRPRASTFDDLVRGAQAAAPLVVVLVGVQDPGNVGTIVRAAEAFGATGVATCKSEGLGTAHPFAPKAVRASAGSALRRPVVHGVSVSVLLAQLRVVGVKLYAASLLGSLAPAHADFRGPAALLVGNEGAGLPPEVECSADERLRIPLAAGVDSLNAAVAASVLLYEAARQRREPSPGPG